MSLLHALCLAAWDKQRIKRIKKHSVYQPFAVQLFWRRLQSTDQQKTSQNSDKLPALITQECAAITQGVTPMLTDRTPGWVPDVWKKKSPHCTPCVKPNVLVNDTYEILCGNTLVHHKNHLAERSKNNEAANIWPQL